MKANEFLNRRLTVADCPRAHVVALTKAPRGERHSAPRSSPIAPQTTERGSDEALAEPD
jgi:hypothetical protein